MSVSVGKDLLLKEAEALTKLANNLDDSFTKAVDLLAGISGKVIVTGMGKSGHIGAKIAATLASTGTPAFFVHPGEASHGDLGMITANDAVIALSHSGESKELGDIISFCARYKIPLIALTGRAGSTLGKNADIALLNGVTVEACPLNLAPTSSTTTTLALGDALAVALMAKKGFKAEDFSAYHPGGKLGSQLLKVSEIMAVGSALPLVSPTTTMDDVIVELTDKNLGCAGIVEGKKLLGIITDGDLRRYMSPELLSKQAQEIMTKNPVVIMGDILAVAAVKQMQDKKITVLFVVNSTGEAVGLVHMHQCLQAGIV